MKLASQIIFLGATAVSTLFFVIAIILYIGFPGEQEQLLKQGGRALIENLRLRINPMVLTDDTLSLNDALIATKLSDENIIYIFVLDKNKLPLASTYSRGVPGDLIDFVSQRKDESTVKFYSEDFGSCINISAPLMSGDLGSLHLGVNRDSIKAFANESIFKLSMTFAIISVLSIALAVLIGRGVGRPLSQIANALRKVESRWPQLDHINPGPTLEIQEFAAILKQMIHELEQAEQKRQNYEQKLLATERMASIGQLAAEVAHEINNPLDGLIEITRYLEQVGEKPEKARKYLPLMRQGLEQIERIGRKLLRFSHKDSENYSEVFDVCTVINDTVTLLSGSMKKRSVFVAFSHKRRCIAVGNAVATGQAVMNLLLNAADAMENEGGRINIDVTSDNGNVLIAVEDEGPGISEEISRQIFEPFFSTKRADAGTGLGLAVSRNLIRRGGGELLLAEGKIHDGGARFVIRLIAYDRRGKHNGSKS
ncbi:MAG: sensor histidine kinase [Planctomycetota bacterium]|jgi:signal transduction histidine kinase